MHERKNIKRIFRKYYYQLLINLIQKSEPMKQKPIKELLMGLKLTFVSKASGINYNTLHAQLNPNNPRKLTLENELRIRQIFDK